MDKGQLRQAILDTLQRELDTQTRAALMSHEEATHEESKAENKYDMHAQEAAYLAEGQARLVKELTEAIALYHGVPVDRWPPGKPIGVGALVQIEFNDRIGSYFVGPRNGGMEVEVGGETVTVVTPSSPLGRQLIGANIGQAVQLPGRKTADFHRVAAIE